MYLKYNTVLSNLISKNQFNHKLAKTLQFTTIKMQNTQNNHEDFNRIVTGLWVKARGKQKEMLRFIELKTKDYEYESSSPNLS